MVGVAVCVTVVMGVVSWRLSDSVFASEGWVRHTLDVERQFDALLRAVGDAESGQRGFLLVRDETYLMPYRKAIAVLDSQLSTLMRLVADNSEQHERVTQLAALVRKKAAELGETVDLARRGDQETAWVIVASNRGQALMDRIRETTEAGLAAEERLLADRDAALNASIKRGGYLIWSLVLLNAVVLVALVIAMRRLERLESLVTVCAWSKTIRYEEEWVSFEEYLTRRFHVRISHGMSPAETQRMMAEVEQMAVFDRR